MTRNPRVMATVVAHVSAETAVSGGAGVAVDPVILSAVSTLIYGALSLSVASRNRARCPRRSSLRFIARISMLSYLSLRSKPSDGASRHEPRSQKPIGAEADHEHEAWS